MRSRPMPRRSHAVNGSWSASAPLVHRTKLGREQLGIAAADAKDDERAGIADDGRADGMRKLIGVLVRERKMRGELSRL